MRYAAHRSFPAYAYLPGRFPHPVRHPSGHSHGITPTPPVDPAARLEAFAWGADLFNHGYYWEAHEAWEEVWQLSGGHQRLYLKALILLCAAGVKVRENKGTPAMRHGGRAAATMSRLTEDPKSLPLHCVDLTPQQIIEGVRVAVDQSWGNTGANSAPVSVFSFELHPAPSSAS